MMRTPLKLKSIEAQPTGTRSDHGPVTSRGKSAPGPDPRIRHRTQIGMFRPIRVDHTNCLQVAIKTHSFIQLESVSRGDRCTRDATLKEIHGMGTRRYVLSVDNDNELKMS
jgi:hypothetical protein